MRHKYKYHISDRDFLDKTLFWTEDIDIASLLLSNTEIKSSRYSKYDAIIAVGCIDSISIKTNCFHELGKFHKKHLDWVFGYISYDAKNDTERLYSNNFDGIFSPDMMFYVPETILFKRGNQIIVESILSKNKIDNYILDIKKKKVPLDNHSINLRPRENKSTYLSKIKQIKKHIQNGDIYELTYCQEFYSENEMIDPRSVFARLNNKSKAPFSVFFRSNDLYLLCASPERYLQKSGTHVISQPIKGTRRRGVHYYEDLHLKNELNNSQKDKSENIMIADLVRNDLSKTARNNSVNVKELCAIYDFKTVYQMISTIESHLDQNYTFIDLIKSTFPMGSMTGVPKIKAMELIESFETSKRSIYSGSFGYITPEGDCDFNVVIRSILYNASKKYVSVMAGGAITIDSEPEEEYHECMVKAEAMIDVLKNKDER